MRFVLLLTLALLSVSTIAQNAKYQIYTAELIATAEKGDTVNNWKNKNIIVNLDYQNGNFNIKTYSKDITNDQPIIEFIENTDNQPTIFNLSGIVPIEKIINQKQTSQAYDIELELVNTELNISQIVHFNMNVVKPQQVSKQYRIFTLVGSFYNDEVKIPAFKSYDNEVVLKILFNAFWNE